MRTLEGRYPPEAVHSVVVVTKFPEAILARPVRYALARYDQVVAQVTITGLGGTLLEPRVPDPERALAALPRLVEFVGSPERVVVRIDPIVRWRPRAAREEAGDGPRGAEARGGEPRGGGPQRAETLTNQTLFGEIARRARAAGVTRVKTSLASSYRKVVRHFGEAGLELVTLEGREREEALAALEREAAGAGLALEFCCEPTRPRAACVDAALLTRLHPRGLAARADRATGQREHCGCSHSVDLAWYASHPCPSGCLYCYANPIIARSSPGPLRPPGPGRGEAL